VDAAETAGIASDFSPKPCIYSDEGDKRDVIPNDFILFIPFIPVRKGFEV
jgi:hypothetical protein